MNQFPYLAQAMRDYAAACWMHPALEDPYLPPAMRYPWPPLRLSQANPSGSERDEFTPSGAGARFVPVGQTEPKPQIEAC